MRSVVNLSEILEVMYDIKVGNLWIMELLKNSVCERRVAYEPAVKDEAAGAIAEHKRRKDCLINYL